MPTYALSKSSKQGTDFSASQQNASVSVVQSVTLLVVRDTEDLFVDLAVI